MGGIGETGMDYNSRTLQSIVADQSARYFKYTKQFSERVDDKDTADLACKVGYILNIASGIHKSFKQEKRLKILEEKLRDSIPNMAIFEEAPLKEYR